MVWWKKSPRPNWMTHQQYEEIPDWLHLRVVRVRVRQRGFRVKELVVVTTILEPAAASREDLAELYRARWQAELDLRSLKDTLQMGILRGQSPEMVRKELWGHLLVYNIVRGLMAQAARTWSLIPRQVSFKGALQTVLAFAEGLREGTAATHRFLWRVMLRSVAADAVGDRPDRVEPRAVKRRPKPYPLLMVPRRQAKAALLQAS